jgi:hypothetical protein
VQSDGASTPHNRTPLDALLARPGRVESHADLAAAVRIARGDTATLTESDNDRKITVCTPAAWQPMTV